MTVIALTGATGFVGGEVLDLATSRGLHIRALTRRPQPERDGVIWVPGALDDVGALAELVRGADAVLHVAGVVNAPDRAGFQAGNVTGTQLIVGAATAAGVHRFVHVSSLAAREPALSDYGWSKAEAEKAVANSPLDWVMVRPPAIYGPGDREMLDLFRAGKRGIIPLPPHGKLSVIHAADLARLLVDLSASPDLHEGVVGKVLEVDDGRTGGWSHVDFGRAIAAAVGRPKALIVSVPAAVVRAGARIDGLVRGARAKLTADRASYFCHPDWTITPERRPSPNIWQPQIDTERGLAETAAAYRAKNWL